MRVFLAIIMLILSPPIVHGDANKPAITKHYEESLAQTTEKGLFSVEMVLHGQKLEMGVNRVDLIIHDSEDRDVPGAEISVIPWMPLMNHGVSEKPQVTERGGGLYSASNIILVMTGHWQLKVTVTKGDLEDNATFDFPHVQFAGHDHGPKGFPGAGDIDTARVQFSENKAFKVSYEIEREPLSINRFSRWTVTVRTPDGTPVTGARITLVGDMPEHGHGFPTNPEITRELGEGKYLAEGIKFNMPGWWVVTFHIRASGKEDRVNFNLDLR